MFALFGFIKTSYAANENAICIYVDKTDDCAVLAKSFSDTTTTYTAVNLTMADVNTSSVTGANRIVIFVQPNEITSEQLLILSPDGINKVYAYACQVTVKVTADAVFKAIPLSLTYTGGPIVFKPTDLTLSREDIQKIKIDIKLQSTMAYTIYDTVDSTIPVNFKVDAANSGVLSYTLQSASLDVPRLIIDGDSCHWGKTTFTPGESIVKPLKNTIISCTDKAPKIPVKVGDECYFDETFKTAETGKEYAEVKTTAYVQDENSIAYLKKDGSVTVSPYKVYCVQETKQTAGCANSGFTELITHMAVTEAVPADKYLVAIEGELTIPDDKLDLLKKPLITKDAKSITVVCDTGKVPDAGIDMKKPIWKLTKKTTTAASSLTAIPITVTGIINPKVVNSLGEGLSLAAGGLATTPENKEDVLDVTKVTFSTANIPIVPYGEGDAKVDVQKEKIIVNGHTVPVPTSKNIALHAVPGQSVKLSQNGATEAFAITVLASGNVDFDSTWNTMDKPIVSVSGGSVSTQFVGGVPPFMNSHSVASQGVILQPDPITPGGTEPSSGLEGWAIALIVIACVVVVGVIVVVALQLTGVIHLCGKPKVEV